MIYRHHMSRGGWRGVVLIKKGPKWATIFEYSSLRNHTVSTRDFENPQYTLVENIDPNKLARRIEERRKQYKRLNIFSKKFTDKPAREAVKILKEG
jgi:hypothetical protein